MDKTVWDINPQQFFQIWEAIIHQSSLRSLALPWLHHVVHEEDLVNTDSSNGLSDGTKPLPKPILIRKFDGLVQDCSISSVNALEILQSCNKPTEWYIVASWGGGGGGGGHSMFVVAR